MPKRLSEEIIKKIRELQNSGMSDYRISKILKLSYSTVHYQRPEYREKRKEYKRRRYHENPKVREYAREYWKKYFQRPEVRERIRKRFRKPDPEWEEFLSFIKYNNVYINPNSYTKILLSLYRRYGLKHKQIRRMIGIDERHRITHKLKKLLKNGFIKYENKRYSLTDKGRKICEHLFQVYCIE